jgi:transcriptional regulator of nitric oxide reductase
MDTAFRSSARPATEEAVPFLWNVLVRRLEKAEARQRIAVDWETFAFGTPALPTALLFGQRPRVPARWARHARSRRPLS